MADISRNNFSCDVHHFIITTCASINQGSHDFFILIQLNLQFMSCKSLNLKSRSILYSHRYTWSCESEIKFNAPQPTILQIHTWVVSSAGKRTGKEMHTVCTVNCYLLDEKIAQSIIVQYLW